MIPSNAALASLAIASTALGQSINIAFGDAAPGSAPQADYAAAGQAGVWNVVSDNSMPAQELVGLDGNATGATLAIATFFPIESFTVDDEQTSGGDEQLFDDFLPGAGDIAYSVSFSGLENGFYDVISYAWTPTAPENFSGVFIGEDYENGQTVGGTWPGELTLGVTHAMHTVQVVDGTFSITLVGAYLWTSGALNGVQLIKAEPATADLNGDQTVNVGDLLILLSNWNTDGHGCDGVTMCVGDLNYDTYINISDLMLLLGAWGS
ncbi:MAG: hypothetical protein L0219_19680 [Phycisphaerales bacterium]|nr:hypothetical protein [Phycisphaerales bacterium]